MPRLYLEWYAVSVGEIKWFFSQSAGCDKGREGWGSGGIGAGNKAGRRKVYRLNSFIPVYIVVYPISLIGYSSLVAVDAF